MDAFTNGVSIGAVLDILKRRGWIALVLFSVCLTGGIGLITALPNMYRAGATILVEGQQIPEEYVRTTVTMPVDRRLQLISEEVFSRGRLEQIITQFNLYEGLKGRGASKEEILTVMRRDIDLEVKGKMATKKGVGTVAFEISYTNLDPKKAMEIANLLASFYIEENTKVREEQAGGTSKFLGKQLETTKTKLESQEQQITLYKQKYMGDLPEQLPSNLSTLTMLQTQMQVIGENLARAHERQNNLLTSRIVEGRIITPAGTTISPDSLPGRLQQLRQSLVQMKTHFSDKHPDIIRLKAEVAELEGQLARETSESSSQSVAVSPARTITPVLSQETTINAEIDRLNADLQKIRNDIVKYQLRIEQTPRREQDLLVLSRDYNSTRELYASLLKRLEEATLANSLEQGQQGERFRLIEPATQPRAPIGPKRGFLFVLAAVLGLGLAISAVFIRERSDTSFHQVEALKAFTELPILGTVPRLVTEQERRQRRYWCYAGASALFVGLLALGSLSYRFGVGNEQVVRIFLK
jgi:succinoglycan biosynthesis transport protein ExoP